MKLLKILIKIVIVVFIILLIYYLFVGYKVLKTENIEKSKFEVYKNGVVDIKNHIISNYGDINISNTEVLSSEDTVIINFFETYPIKNLSYNTQYGILNIGLSGIHEQNNYYYSNNYKDTCIRYKKDPGLFFVVLNHMGTICLGNGWFLTKPL